MFSGLLLYPYPPTVEVLRTVVGWIVGMDGDDGGTSYRTSMKVVNS